MTHDFADWLSPMLVKELRQGLRSRILISSLFILQGLLLVNVIIAFSADKTSDIRGITTFFWTVLSLPLLIILPFSGLTSVGGEIKNNTLELIFLTRLNAWRIVFGKWIAIVVQSLLLAITVLPYIALRYYLGGVNLLGDLATVGGILLGSAVLSAVTIGVSPYQSKIIRVFLGLGFFMLLQGGGVMMTVMMAGGAGGFGVLRGGGLPDWWLYAGILIFLPIFVFLMLGMAASRIAPLAENHSGPRRFLALLALIICGVVSILGQNVPWLTIVGQVIVTPVCIGALSENFVPLSSPYRPFVKRGLLGRLAARFFTPGWHSGFLFTLLVLCILPVFWWRNGWLQQFPFGKENWLIVSLLAFAATLLLPPALTPDSVKKRWIAYAILFIGTALFFFATSIIGAITKSELKSACLVLPPAAIFAKAFDGVETYLPMLIGWMALLLVFSVIFILLRSRKPFREMKALFAEAELPMPHHDA